jgi:hypothetical protein
MNTAAADRTPGLDESVLRRLPPPDPAQRIPDDRVKHLDNPAELDNEPEWAEDEEEPWWRRDTGG